MRSPDQQEVPVVTIGVTLSSEEHEPRALVDQARMAEEAGFRFAIISDHFHPWTDAQGQSPFVWGVLGAIAHATDRLVVGTGVTCPTMRIHPVIIAQASATAAALMPGRFFLGVGSGERLNEHIFGDAWPSPLVRLEMLEEAIEVIRLMWRGGLRHHRGRYYTVDAARLYTLPDQPPALLCAAAGPTSARLAGARADGIIGTAPKRELIDAFVEAGGAGKPRIAQLAVCWAKSVDEARATVLDVWPNAALGGNLGQELSLPRDYEAAVRTVREEDIAPLVPCGPDPRPFIEQMDQYVEAGFDHINLHQIGRDQAGFIRFYKQEIEQHFAGSGGGVGRLALAS